ncbi:spore germination protein [Bacillus marasmi]|uniref:spore germination protein n=1 Tax=Bacillus marasmi TaxID=1926279 RepID=UPI00164CE1B6|nr:spore germination protein [Bacillus marasmi]
MKQNSKINKILKHFKEKNNGTETIPNHTLAKFSTKLEENETALKKLLGKSPDLIYRNFSLNFSEGHSVQTLIIFIDGLVLETAVRQSVIKPLVEEKFQECELKLLNEIKGKISSKRVTEESDPSKVIEEVLKGKLLLMVDGVDTGLIIHVEAFEFLRAVEEPTSEKTVRGARDGFIESTSVNISLLRRRIAHPSLTFDTMKIGEISQTNVVIAYIEGIADPDLINRVKERLKQIKVDAINSGGDIEQYIEDHPYSIFPTIGNTERPDKGAFLLLEGRILVFCDGDPVSLFVPTFFMDNIKAIEDYYSRPYFSSFVRLLRFAAFMISTILPAFYLSALNFNKELIPSDLLVPIIQAREMVPFSLWMELFFMIGMFEVVREAGVRLPQQVGAALSIVGALILGQVAVSAGIVGAPTIVVISITYISAFVLTPMMEIVSLVRVGLLITSLLFGPFGFIVALLGLLTHMVSLTSLGVPFMSPLAPANLRDFKDTFIRFPSILLKHRRKSVPNKRDVKIQSLPDTGDKQ